MARKKNNHIIIPPEETKRIKERLQQLSLTQTELAAQLGIKQPYFCRIINGAAPLSDLVKEKLYSSLELSIPYFQEYEYNNTGSINTFEKANQLHLYSLFVDYVHILQAHYQTLPKEDKLKLLAGLEALVQDYKPNSSE